MNVRAPEPSLAEAELDDIEQRLLHHRAIVPAWQVQRLVSEVRRLKALEDEWRRGLATAIHAGDQEALMLAAREIIAGRNGHVARVTQVLPEAD